MTGKIHQAFIPIGRFIFVLLILVGTFVFAMFQGGFVSWAIFYAVLPFTLYSLLLFLYPLTSFRAKRTLATTYLQSGDTLRVRVTISRAFPFPLLYTAFSDRWMDGGQEERLGELNAMRVLGWKRHMEWHYEIQGMKRGEYTAPNIRIEVTDFFGWIRKRTIIPVSSSVLVYPRTADIGDIRDDVGEGEKHAVSLFDLLKDTRVVAGVRDYQSGDRMSWIHWKSFARTQTLMTKEFEDSSSKNLSIIFDGRASVTFEEEITFVGSLLKGALSERLSVHFLPIHRKRFFPCIESEAQFKVILKYLAKVQPVQENQIDIPSVLKKELGENGMMMLITARPDRQLIDEIRAARKGRQTLICFLVVEEKVVTREMFLEEVKYAQTQGVTVQIVTGKQFTHAVKEVMQR